MDSDKEKRIRIQCGTQRFPINDTQLIENYQSKIQLVFAVALYQGRKLQSITIMLQEVNK